MSEDKKEPKKSALDLEIGSLASGIVNKVSGNIAIRCNKVIGAVNLALQIGFFLCVLGYVPLISNAT